LLPGRLQPELVAIKQEFKKDPMREQKEISELHKRHGISLVDGPGLIGALIQLPVLIALFQAAYHITRDTTLASSGIVVGLIASALSAGGLWLNGQGDSKVMLVLFGVLPLVMALWLGQGIGLYLIGLNVATALQGVLLRRWPNTIKPVASTA
jgi:membrane protein insertase Oxa1/YidC/SpoIIIJ